MGPDHAGSCIHRGGASCWKSRPSPKSLAQTNMGLCLCNSSLSIIRTGWRGLLPHTQGPWHFPPFQGSIVSSELSLDPPHPAGRWGTQGGGHAPLSYLSLGWHLSPPLKFHGQGPSTWPHPHLCEEADRYCRGESRTKRRMKVFMNTGNVCRGSQ